MDDAADFDAFYDATNRRVLHQLYAMTGSLTVARDCAHEAYARAWRRWTTVSSATSPEAWTRALAWRLAGGRRLRARSGLGGARRHRSDDAGAPSPGNADVVAALQRLPEKQRYAVVLHNLAGSSVEDIALETGVSIGTARTRLSRGQAALSRLLPDDTTILTGGSRD